ncbi:MAG: aminoglycoside phosphotransferase family protein [Thermomicrobiales bacterium]
MLEPPDIAAAVLGACLRDDFDLHATRVEFLPIGNDVNTAVYRVVADDARPYFLKLRSGPFPAATVAIPRFLHDAGVAQVIAPRMTRAGQLWARVERFAAMLFPFVAGRNGFAVPLTERQWMELGGTLRKLHDAAIPAALRADIPMEQYSSHWRDRARELQRRVEESVFADPVAKKMARFLRDKRGDIDRLVSRAGVFADDLRARTPQQVLCHADIHAANVLIDANGRLFVVDWDTLIFAPKERDLMFIGAGIGGAWNRAEEQEWFYRGYGETTVDPVALAYYRHERFVEDVVEYGERLLLTEEGGADRAAGFDKFIAAFLPGDVVEIAFRSDPYPGLNRGNS